MIFLTAVTTAIVTWLVIRLVLVRYLRYRRKTQSGQEWQQYKARLPNWVKQIERLIWIALWLPLFVGLILLLREAYFAVHAGQQQQPDGATVGLTVLSSGFVALVFALLLANTISWLVPPIRNANLAAMCELETVSLRAANIGLVKVGLVVIPVALVFAALAVFSPWTN